MDLDMLRIIISKQCNQNREIKVGDCNLKIINKKLYIYTTITNQYIQLYLPHQTKEDLTAIWEELKRFK